MSLTSRAPESSSRDRPVGQALGHSAATRIHPSHPSQAPTPRAQPSVSESRRRPRCRPVPTPAGCPVASPRPARRRPRLGMKDPRSSSYDWTGARCERARRPDRPRRFPPQGPEAASGPRASIDAARNSPAPDINISVSPSGLGRALLGTEQQGEPSNEKGPAVGRARSPELTQPEV
jgi:hypothetical protein